jgi:dienelactone hydrolase
MHAFTNPTVNDLQGGIAYDATADRRSWTAMSGFLEEALRDTD